VSKYVQLPTGTVTDTTQAVGVVTITTGGGGGAPTNASYVVLGSNVTLTNERTLTAGTGITLTDGGAGGNLTIASSGGSGNAVTTVIDFGTGKGDHSTSTVVTGQTWVTGGSNIVTSIIDYVGENSAEDASIEGITIAVGDIVAGTGFTVYASSPFGSVGKYQVSCMGV
jgi:hypothetical protein